MSRWFRMYDEVLDDPKVQRLSGEDFKAWVNILCLASRNEGNLPTVEDISFALRLDSRKTTATLGRITAAGLIDNADGTLSPHGWSARQYKSDVSTDRVKKFRERKKGVSGNGGETFHATAPDTDTETDVSLAKASAPTVDEDTAFWASAKAYLGPTRGSLIGKWVKAHGREATAAAIAAAQVARAVEPVEFIQGRFRLIGREAADIPLC